MSGAAPTRPRSIAFWAALLALGAALFAIARVAEPLAITGDEPRYLRYAYEIFQSGRTTGPFERWAAFAASHGLPAFSPETFVSIHAPFHAALLAPGVGLWGPEGGRWTSWAAGIGLMVVIALTVRRETGSALAAVLAAAATALSTPVLAYSRLMYGEVILALALAAAFHLATSPRLNRGRAAGAVALALALPFLHLRLALAGAALVAVVLWRIVPVRRGRAAPVKGWLPFSALLCLLSALALAGFVAFQVHWTGSLAGSASAPYQPSLGLLAERLGIQLFGFRHGLLAIAPVFLLGLAGLVAAGTGGDRPALLALGLIGLLAATFIWGTASESAPGRFWVAAAAPLALGIGHWARRARGAAAWAVAGVLALYTGVNTWLYAGNPDLFLANRLFPLSFDSAFQAIGGPYIGPYLPWDPADLGAFGRHPDPALNAALIAGCLAAGGAALLLLAAAALPRIGPRACGAAGGAALALLVVLAAAGWQDRMAGRRFDVAVSTPDTLTILFPEPQAPTVLRLGRLEPIWRPEAPEALRVTYTRADGSTGEGGTVPARQFMPLPEMGRVASLTLTAPSGRFSWDMGRGVRLLRGPLDRLR